MSDTYDPEDDGSDEMYGEVGYFISQYSTVEIGITAILAILVNISNYEAFHTLTRGMDAKIKVERLREVAKQKNLILPDGNLDLRLTHFIDKTASLRNKIAHMWLVPILTHPPRILFSSMAKMPFDVLKMERRYGDQPDEITFECLREHSNWLGYFQEDVVSLIGPAKKGAALELEKPRSMGPTAFLQHLQKVDALARARTPRQKPLPK